MMPLNVFLKKMDWVCVWGQKFYKVYVPHTGTEHLLYAKHSARCLKCKTAYNVVL